MHGAQASAHRTKRACRSPRSLPADSQSRLDVYDGWVGVVVYPGEFRVRKEEMDRTASYTFDDELACEAWPGGAGDLSWEDVGLAERGYTW